MSRSPTKRQTKIDAMNEDSAVERHDRPSRGPHAKKAGHAGTLDPLASGILPIALGEATKTVPFVMDGRKSYVFTVAWGVETDTDDAEGRPVSATNTSPDRAAVQALLPRFTGSIEQIPPRFSAIKIKGERACDLGRALGCLGHVAALRRTRVGPFAEETAVTVGDIEAARDGAGAGMDDVL